MITADISQAIQDSLAYVNSTALATDAKEHSELYKYLAGGMGGLLLLFASYVLISWNATIKTLKDSIVSLNGGVSLLSEEIHLNRADEVSHRGLEIIRHTAHDNSFVLLNVKVDEIESDVAIIKEDLKELKTEHKIFHGKTN